jgi:SPOR domain
MSMAQDSNLRHARSDPYARESAPAGNDPLAELARLIGQNDPFTDAGKDARAPARPAAAAPQEAPEWLARPSGAPPQSAHPQSGPEASYDEQPAYQDPNQQYQDDPRYQDPRYEAEYQGAYAGSGAADDPAYGYQQDAYYDDQQGYDDQAYEAPPPERRRGGLMTVAAVVALAVFGTAAAFGYRAWTGGSSGTSGEPPVIKAEQTPTKVVPPAAGSDGQMTKQVYERAGDRGGERVMSREEQPMDPRTAARPSGQSVLPPLGSTAPTPMAAGDPKPVKTMTIRPDQAGIAAAQPQAVQPQQAARPPVAAAPPPAPNRVATIPIQSAPPRSQAENGFLVQVSSQRSEADAQTSFRSLQQKYPAVLGGHKATIRRADLGDRGIYYRANVGPFASREEATQLCSELTKAGGQCLLVQPQ